MDLGLRKKIDAYLRGDITLVALRKWILGATWNNDKASEVAHAAAYFIDEASSGNYSRSELDEELKRLAAGKAKASGQRRQPAGR